MTSVFSWRGLYPISRPCHSQERNDAAIPMAVRFLGTTEQAEGLSGLPQACGHHNDGVVVAVLSDS